jgi:hypothetical protein
MKFNTAILYDIENLMGGYGNTDLLSTFSLKDIHNEIAKKETGNIAIQRAYANWSDPRLNIMRGDIIELGIEPAQRPQLPHVPELTDRLFAEQLGDRIAVFWRAGTAQAVQSSH